jgi:hypothetical protein
MRREWYPGSPGDRDSGGPILLGVPSDHLEDLRIQAQYASERYRLYRAKSLGGRPTSPQRLRELQRASEQAEERLRFAQSEAGRTPGADQSDD